MKFFFKSTRSIEEEMTNCIKINLLAPGKGSTKKQEKRKKNAAVFFSS